MAKRMIKSIPDLQNVIETESKVQNQFKENPILAIKQFKQQKNPLDTDPWIYRIIVTGLSITIISIIIGVLLLISSDHIEGDQGVPTILTAIGSAAIGALAGLLAPPPKGSSNS